MQPKYHILCVDDNEDTCFMLSHLLGHHGYEMLSASTTSKALEMARARRFDLYLLDNRLPDGIGTELCRALKVLHPDTLVVFYSGDAYPSQHSEAKEAGAAAYVDKPNIDRLLVTLKNLLPDFSHA